MTLTAVVTVGVFAGIAAFAAFLLSFQMILPVVKAAGWSGAIAPLGPIVIDVAAVAAAFMSVLSLHKTFANTGRLLLVSATALSIAMNLSGHQVKQRNHATTVPPGWEWSVWLFSVTVPIVLAALIHAFGSALAAYSQQKAERKRQEAAEAERQRREAEEAERRRQEAEQAEIERQAQLDAIRERARDTGTVQKSGGKSGQRGTKKVKPSRADVVTLGVASFQGRSQVTMKDVRELISGQNGWVEPSEGTIKNARSEISDKLGLS